MGEADIALRHVTRQHPEELARALVAAPESFEIIGWLDTQVTTLERRLDSALDLRARKARRVLQVEFQVELTDDVSYRVFEYQALVLMALRAEAPKTRLPPIETVVIVLSGRRKPWPLKVAFRTGWPGSGWSGVRYRVEAVYQRTIAELTARGGVLWLVFTPLARDATVGAMRDVLATIRQQVPEERERQDLFTAMLVMADLDPWGHNLREEIATMVEAGEEASRCPSSSRTSARWEIATMLEAGEEAFIMRSKTLREAFEKGREQGREQGIEQGVEQLLRDLFVQRVGRVLTPAEQEALADRAHTLGADQVGSAVLRLEGDALVEWLTRGGER
jgi:hypothetical protein